MFPLFLYKNKVGKIMALVIAAMLLITIFSVNAEEIVNIADSPVVLIENFGEHYVVLEAIGRITAYDRNHNKISVIERNATLMKIIDNSRIAAISGGDIYFYKDILKTPQVEKIIRTGLEISAIANLSEMLFIGTKSGLMYKMRIDETTPQLMPGAAKTEIINLAAKDGVLVICSEAENPRLIDLNTGFLEAILVPPNNMQNEFVPTKAIAFRPGHSMELLVAQAHNLFVYDAAVNSNSPIRRLPKNTYNMESPIFSLTYSSDGRFILAGLLNNTAKYIDTGRTDNRGNLVISTRTGFSAGSLVSLISNPAIGVVIAAGRNLYLDSSGSGRVTLNCESNLISSRNYEFIIENLEDKSVERRNFYFGYYTKSNSMTLPEGTFKISTSDTNVAILNDHITIDGINPVTVNITITEPQTPETPRPVAIKPPALPLRPASLIEYIPEFLVSVHQNILMLTGKNSSRVISLQANPYALKTDAGKVLVGFHDRLVIYSATGNILTTVPVSGTAEHLVYKNDVIATAAGNSAEIFIQGKPAVQIEQESQITSIELSSDGKLLLIAIGRMVRIFETESGNEIPLHTLPGRAAITLSAFSGPTSDYPHGRYFAVYSGGAVKICDGIGGHELKTINVGSINFLRFDSFDRLVIHNTARNIQCVNINSGTTIYETPIAGSVFAILPDETAAYADQSGVIVMRKRSNDIAKIGLTENNAWFFTVRDSSVPEFFQAADSIAAMFTDAAGRLLTPEEITQYKKAQLPLK